MNKIKKHCDLQIKSNIMSNDGNFYEKAKIIKTTGIYLKETVLKLGKWSAKTEFKFLPQKSSWYYLPENELLKMF